MKPIETRCRFEDGKYKIFLTVKGGNIWIIEEDKVYVRDNRGKDWPSLKDIDDIDVVRSFIGVDFRGSGIDKEMIPEGRFLDELIDESVLNGTKELRNLLIQSHCSKMKDETLIHIIKTVDDIPLAKNAVKEMLDRGMQKTTIMLESNEKLSEVLKDEIEHSVLEGESA